MTDEPRSLDISGVFRDDAEEISAARGRAKKIHRTGDIRTAGDEVEKAVRDYLKRMLPARCYVTHGHLIDPDGNTSPQLDVIVADNSSLPSLLTTRNGTEYVPVTSAFAIGEIKSTYASHHYKELRDKLETIHSNLRRPLVKNTRYGGLSGQTVLTHLKYPSDLKYLNRLYSFLFCVDAGTFRFDKIASMLRSSRQEHLPTLSVFLNSGIVQYSGVVDGTFMPYRNAMDATDSDADWCFYTGAWEGKASMEGTHLAHFYSQLLGHIADSDLPRPRVHDYIRDLRWVDGRSIRWARQEDSSNS